MGQVILWAIVGGSLALLTKNPVFAVAIGVLIAIIGTGVHLAAPHVTSSGFTSIARMACCTVLLVCAAGSFLFIRMMVAASRGAARETVREFAQFLRTGERDGESDER